MANPLLQQAADYLRKEIEDRKRKSQGNTAQTKKEVLDILGPVLKEIANSSRLTKQELAEVVKSLSITLPSEVKMPSVNVNVPDVIVPNITVPPSPRPQVTVNVPEIRMPKMEWPTDNMPIQGWVQLMGVDLANPLPVQLRDMSGKPVSFSEGQVSGGARIVKVSSFGASAFAEITNPDGRVKVELPTGSSSLTDTELRASSVDVQQASGATWSVYVNNPVAQGDAATALRVVVAGNSDVSVTATQTGTWNIGTVTTVTGVTNSVAASIVDSGGIQYSGSNPIPINLVSQSLASSASALVDSTGIQYSGSNPLPITGNVNVNGSLNSVITTGVTLHDAADVGDAPLKVGGIAMTANPTAVAAGDRVSARFDDIGRQLIRPVQVRDLTATAYVSVANGTETTLLAASAGSYHDLIYLMAANSSDAAVLVDVRGVTAGNVLMTVGVPAYGTAGITCPLPLPQQETGNNWTVDLPDITGTTVYVTALFSREV